MQDTLNPIWSYEENTETTTHYLPYCPKYSNERMTLLNNFPIVEENILDTNYFRFSETLVFGDSSFNVAKNTTILNATIQYIFGTKRCHVNKFMKV